jgi:hypothetical protein
MQVKSMIVLRVARCKWTTCTRGWVCLCVCMCLGVWACVCVCVCETIQFQFFKKQKFPATILG